MRMNFQEKLQLLRMKARLSQEELASELNISRQSVTKWENGQSFPDIENLIRLSEIFKVSIDRLVKENDGCSPVLSEEIGVSGREIRAFLFEAKRNTYAAGKNESFSSRPHSHDFRFEDKNFQYVDTYLGGQKFIGEEAVWRDGGAVWGMNYYGQSLSESFDGDFLKEALSQPPVFLPVRGPEVYQRGDYIYCCRICGEFERFSGEERIFCGQEKVYFCLFHGGSLR